MVPHFDQHQPVVNMASNEQEQAILQRQLHGLVTEHTNRRNLLKYSTFLDKVILSISFLCAVLGGVLNPIISVSRRRLIALRHKALIICRSSTAKQ